VVAVLVATVLLGSHGVEGEEVLQVTKDVTAITDYVTRSYLTYDPLDGNCVRPGQGLQYRIEVTNTLSHEATNLFLSDKIDGTLAQLVEGSVEVEAGVNCAPAIVTTGNFLDDDENYLEVTADVLYPGDSLIVNFNVILDSTVEVPLSTFPFYLYNIANLTYDYLDYGQVSVLSSPLASYTVEGCETPVCVEPTVDVSLTKSADASRLNDGVDGTGSSILSYKLRAINQGDVAATKFELSDVIPQYFEIVPESLAVSEYVDSSCEVVLGDTTVYVACDTLPASFVVDVEFDVQLLEEGETYVPAEVTNEAVATFQVGGREFEVSSGVVAVPVDFGISLVAQKTASLVYDADGDGVADSGDVLLYQVFLTSTGGADVVDVTLEDSPVDGTVLLAGSVQVPAGATVLNGNSLGDASVLVAIPGVLTGGCYNITGEIVCNDGPTLAVSFQVVVDTRIPAYETSLTNVALVRAANLASVTASVEFPVEADVCLSVGKVASVYDDATPTSVDLLPRPGSEVCYDVRIINSGTQDSGFSSFYDCVDSNLQIDYQSLSSDVGNINVTTSGAILVDIENIPGAGGCVNIHYCGTVADPFVQSASTALPQMSNQGVLYYASDAEAAYLEQGDLSCNPEECTLQNEEGISWVLSDDPTTEEHDATVLLLDGAQNVLAAMSVIETTGESDPRPYLTYTVEIYNAGDVTAPAVTFTNTFDTTRVQLVTGSVTATATATEPTVTWGNLGAHEFVEVLIPSVAGRSADVITITYQVVVVEEGDGFITNQGQLTGATIEGELLTYDPSQEGYDSPTSIILATDHVSLYGDLTYALVKRANYNPQDALDSVIYPGDTICYTATVFAEQSAGECNVRLSFTPPAGSTILVGSVKTTSGDILRGNKAWYTDVFVENICAGDSLRATVNVDVVVDDPFQNSVAQLEAQAFYEIPFVATSRSNDPATIELFDPTVTPIEAEAEVQAWMHAELVRDCNYDGRANPGDTVRFHVEVENNGELQANEVLLGNRVDDYGLWTLEPGSVVVSQGSVADGNSLRSEEVLVELGTILGGHSATVSYDAVLVEVFPCDRDDVFNQAYLQYHTSSPTSKTSRVSGNRDTRVIDAPVRLHVYGEAALDVYRGAEAASSEGAVPGTSVTHIITITNSGNKDACDVSFHDTLDPSTSLTLTSVTVQPCEGCQIASGNLEGDSQGEVTVNFAKISGAGAAEVVTFAVVLDDPLAANTAELTNEGALTLSDGSSVEADITIAVADPDFTENIPVLRVALAVEPATAEPGDTVVYTATLTNDGNVDADGASFEVAFDDRYMSYVKGSVVPSQGTIVTGNRLADDSVEVNFGTVAGRGGEARVTFSATLVSTWPDTTQYAYLQGSAWATNAPEPVLSAYPATLIVDDPTPLEVDATVRLAVYKSYAVQLDANGNELADPGETLRYTITVQNLGNRDALEAVLRDDPPSDTLGSFKPGSVTEQPSGSGEIILGNNPLHETVEVSLGTLAAGGDAVEVAFDYILTAPWPKSTREVLNQAEIQYLSDAGTGATTTVLSADPSTTLVFDPTVTVVNAAPFLTTTVSIPQGTPLKARTIYTLDVAVTNTGTQVAGTVVTCLHYNDAFEVVPSLPPKSTGTVFSNDTAVCSNLGDMVPDDEAEQSMQIFFRLNPGGILDVSNILFEVIVDGENFEPLCAGTPLSVPGDSVTTTTDTSDCSQSEVLLDYVLPGFREGSVPVGVLPSSLALHEKEGPADDVIVLQPLASRSGRRLERGIIIDLPTVTQAITEALVDGSIVTRLVSGQVFEIRLSITIESPSGTGTVRIVNRLDDETVLIPGTVNTNQGVVTLGNSAGDDEVSVFITDLAAGTANIYVSFLAQVTGNEFGVNGLIGNVAILSLEGFEPIRLSQFSPPLTYVGAAAQMGPGLSLISLAMLLIVAFL